MSKPKKKAPVSREQQRPEPVWGSFPLVQLAVLAAALASAMPPLLPLAASGLLVLLARRVWRGDVHA